MKEFIEEKNSEKWNKKSVCLKCFEAKLQELDVHPYDGSMQYCQLEQYNILFDDIVLNKNLLQCHLCTQEKNQKNTISTKIISKATLKIASSSNPKNYKDKNMPCVSVQIDFEDLRKQLPQQFSNIKSMKQLPEQIQESINKQVKQHIKRFQNTRIQEQLQEQIRLRAQLQLQAKWKEQMQRNIQAQIQAQVQSRFVPQFFSSSIQYQNPLQFVIQENSQSYQQQMQDESYQEQQEQAQNNLFQSMTQQQNNNVLSKKCIASVSNLQNIEKNVEIDDDEELLKIAQPKKKIKKNLQVIKEEQISSQSQPNRFENTQALEELANNLQINKGQQNKQIIQDTQKPEPSSPLQSTHNNYIPQAIVEQQIPENKQQTILEKQLNQQQEQYKQQNQKDQEQQQIQQQIEEKQDISIGWLYKFQEQYKIVENNKISQNGNCSNSIKKILTAIVLFGIGWMFGRSNNNIEDFLLIFIFTFLALVVYSQNKERM